MNPFIAMAMLSTISALGVASFVWPRRETKGSVAYSAIMIILAVLSLLYVFQLLTPSAAAKQPFFTARHALTPIIAALYWVRAARYTDRNAFLEPRYLLLVFVGCFLLVAGIVANPANIYWTPTGTVQRYGLVLIDYRVGPLFWLNVVYIVGVVYAGLLIIIESITGTLESYRTQIAMVVGVGAGEIVLVLFFVSEHTSLVPVLNPWPHIQILMYAAVVPAVPVVWSYFSATTFDIRPLARQAVIQAMDDAVFVIDGTGTLRYTNAPANQILGRPAEAAVEDIPVSVAFADYPGLYERYSAVHSGPSHSTDEQSDVLVYTIDDVDRHYDISISTVPDAAHESTGAVIVARDITEKRRQQEQLRERTTELETKTAQLERQNARLEQFSSFVSHDLRNPLQIASGYVEIARETDDLSYLDDIEDAIERMSEMVDDLRALTRVDQDTLEPEPVDLESAATNAWAYVDTAKASISVESDAPVLADHDYLMHVFENLFRNSVEHGSAANDAGDLQVSVGTFDDGFYIEDDGDGIPEADRDDIFEQGFSSKGDGTGLGMSITRTIADAHDWEITVTESDDGGARFEFGGVKRPTPAPRS